MKLEPLNKYLKFVSAFMAIFSLLWIYFGSLDPFGIYDNLMAEKFFGRNELSLEEKKVFQFAVVPLGATSAAFFVLQYLVAHYAYANRERWAYNAIVISFLFWFFVDTICSIYHGAYFNVFLANISALVLMLPFILFGKKAIEAPR